MGGPGLRIVHLQQATAGQLLEAPGQGTHRQLGRLLVIRAGQSGQMMAAVALLKSTPKPTDANIEQSMGGNICRCGTYVRIREAIKVAAQQLK